MTVKNFLRTIWELPQYALGYIIAKVTTMGYCNRWEDALVYQWEFNNGLSLGRYIFVPFDADSKYIKHEYGHSIQSKYLGWFYLLVIGLPSLIWCGCFDKYRAKHGISYYDFYTEKWADKLGGVNRNDKQ
jgi:hypothetical protein